MNQTIDILNKQTIKDRLQKNKPNIKLIPLMQKIQKSRVFRLKLKSSLPSIKEEFEQSGLSISIHSLKLNLSG